MPSNSSSPTPWTVTVCGVFQVIGVQISVARAGRSLPSCRCRSRSAPHQRPARKNQMLKKSMLPDSGTLAMLLLTMNSARSLSVAVTD